jgi:heat shock protein HslJ
MACPAPLAGSERQLGEVLARSRQWQVRGSTLVLTGEAGDELATLEAAYFR